MSDINFKAPAGALSPPIDMQNEGLRRGAKIWYRKNSHTWLPAELRCNFDSDIATVSIQIEGESQVQDVESFNILPSNPSLQSGIPDLTHLSYLNEPSILHNLAERYVQDEIYTFAGPVLIALNPCKPLPLYTQDLANKYKSGARDYTNSLKPHVYLIAANAFRKMVREGQSQSLIVNGESGAGKTETTKKAMQYFAALAGGTGIEDQILETNPILEAFGNAKTLRNHNSSRFGKLIQIHFNKSHHMSGATIKTYLLEKSRVVRQQMGERSYHIFYQLIRGCPPEERQSLHLPMTVDGFHYLNRSNCARIDGVDDAAEFRGVCHALREIGVSEEERLQVFSLLSGVLWLGNLEFEANEADHNNDSTKVKQNPALTHASHLLGVSQTLLVSALTTKRIQAAGEIIVKLLSVEESRDSRDALA
eukprot:CAMPEP_0175074708 /NCGR_PEP_ID=MMETSP0052_2-20121109/21489_1 /TAXON_ID=51329 ORGANISM="Polytomella parva, Strain SAG 63-3" /NCGR_SAMPLE_ID=MMETSP0052_2 /ASSEMBLY_ACC=CAM_ASM_000194 /LENGTH=420 /DNA_ID=CAMNT_0016343101 /DNA_START=77 /DNA_END=1336 /DNA_ORIENTATION=+